jgi:hypothetical protein
MAPAITLLTDFGTRDGYVGAMRGVLLSIAPEAPQITITHEIPPHDVARGAFALASSAPWFPEGTVHLAVVDPGVGGPRRAIVASAHRQLYVAPDNGLLTLILAGDAEARTWSIERENLGRAPLHPTFHGRDLFAPVAARLAAGLPPAEVGPLVEDAERLDLAPARRRGRRITATVFNVDRFGNVTLGIAPADLARLGLGDPPRLALQAGQALPVVRTYAEAPPGELVVLWGSAGFLELAKDREPAAPELGVATGSSLTLIDEDS